MSCERTFLLALRPTRIFTDGQGVSISLRTTGSGGALVLEAKAVRAGMNEDGGSSVHGVEFKRFERKTAEALKAFVHD